MARLQLVLLVVVVGGLAGCGRVSHSVRPFSKADGLEAGGSPVLAVGPAGTTLRFLPSVRFGLGIVLHNRSRERLALLDVRVVEPPGTLVRQIGTRLLLWNPPVCKGAHSCPGIGFLRGPFMAATPTPLELRPADGVAVQLDFRLGGCSAVPFAAPAAPKLLRLLYRYNDGKQREQTIPLGSATPHLRMPKAADCAPGPHSQIAVSGPYATGSGWTIPGSSGDTCTLTNRRLGFVSRLYRRPNGPKVKIRIVLPRLLGAGLYRTLQFPAPSRGPARVTAIVGIGPTGWRAFHAVASVVSVTNDTRQVLGGRFRATFSSRGETPFRAYGGWRCTVR